MKVEQDLRCFLGALPPVDFRAVCYIVSEPVRVVEVIIVWGRQEEREGR